MSQHFPCILLQPQWVVTVTGQMSASVAVGTQELAVKLVSFSFFHTVCYMLRGWRRDNFYDTRKVFSLLIPLVSSQTCTHSHTNAQTSSPVNGAVPARMEQPALMTALVGTGVHVLLGTLAPTARSTSTTAAQTRVTMEAPAV